MALDIKKFYGFGAGTLDFVINDTVTYLNSFAPVAAIEENIIRLDAENIFEGDFEKFVAGNEILIHASSTLNNETEKLGNFICAKILNADENILTLDKDISECFTSADLENYFLQAVTIANFKNLTINEGGVLTTKSFSQLNKTGGILALKCSELLNLNGGHISLVDLGIPPTWKDKLRPLTEQEIQGETDSDLYAGKEC